MRLWHLPIFLSDFHLCIIWHYKPISDTRISPVLYIINSVCVCMCARVPCVWMHGHPFASFIANKRQSATLSGNSCDTWTGCRHAGSSVLYLSSNKFSCETVRAQGDVKVQEDRRGRKKEENGAFVSSDIAIWYRYVLWLCSCVFYSPFLSPYKYFFFFLRSGFIASWQTYHMCMLVFNTNTGGQRRFTESSTWAGTRGVSGIFIRIISYDKSWQNHAFSLTT